MTTTKRTAKPSTTTAATNEAAPATTTDASSVVFVQQPPKDAKIPTPPAGFVPTAGTDSRGLLPKKAHMAAIPDALSELDRFTDFTQVFGMTAPPLAYTKQTLSAAGNWSLQRAQLRSWDLYCRTQEGMAWRGARQLIDRMAPAFALATATDSTVAQRYPGFARLFSASKQIAQKGVATRKANAKLKAEGKTPTKGFAAKAKQKQTAKSLLEAAQTPPTSPPASAPPTATSGASGSTMVPVSLVTPVSLASLPTTSAAVQSPQPAGAGSVMSPGPVAPNAAAGVGAAPATSASVAGTSGLGH
jgi:hypothetical protein